MIKLDKIYTKGGDKGQTSLGDGHRVSKNEYRIKAYGDIDEANSTIGIAYIYSSDELRSILRKIQHHLFDIGADLCKPYQEENSKRFEKSVLFLEGELDKLNEMIASQKGVDLAGLSIQPDTTAAGTSGKNEAKLMLARAERLEKKMNVLKERAYELDPELKPKKGRPKKQTEEA